MQLNIHYKHYASQYLAVPPLNIEFNPLLEVFISKKSKITVQNDL